MRLRKEHSRLLSRTGAKFEQLRLREMGLLRFDVIPHRVILKPLQFREQ
jgi:hypothetical protein